MPINSIKGFSSSSRINQSFNAETKNTQTVAAQNAGEQKTENKDSKSKIPYIAGAVVLAGLGIFAAKSLKGKNLGKIKDDAQKAGQKVGEFVEEAKSNVAKKAEETVSKVAEKAPEKISQNTSQAGELVVTKMPEKKPKLTLKESVRESAKDAEDAVIVSEQNTQKLPAEQKVLEPLKDVKPAAKAVKEEAEKAVENKDNKPAISNLIESLKKSSEQQEKLKLEYWRFRLDRAQNIGREVANNTWNGYTNVSELERIAGVFLVDKNRLYNVDEAAQLLEKTYETAYIIKNGDKTQQGIGNIYKRVTEESNHKLFEVYSNMPQEAFPQRIRTWVSMTFPNEAEYSYKEGEMTSKEFIKKMTDSYNEYLKNKK